MFKALGIGIAALALASAALAEVHFGVKVYPGAKAAPEVARQLKEQFKLDAATYRTSDAPGKVVEFYRKELKQSHGGTEKSASFTVPGAMVTIQNPWMDMKSGKILNDTLISIAKQ